jgi:hypothetical protein
MKRADRREQLKYWDFSVSYCDELEKPIEKLENSIEKSIEKFKEYIMEERENKLSVDFATVIDEMVSFDSSIDLIENYENEIGIEFQLCGKTEKLDKEDGGILYFESLESITNRAIKHYLFLGDFETLDKLSGVLKQVASVIDQHIEQSKA